jgi:phosphoribosylformylglycinamidine synthase
MIGGLIGKDGIHGATFSSEGLSSASPTSAVQIGDPITQKRMSDFLMVARDRCLYNFITDNGAGGLSSSLGEMAEECGGLSIDLSKAPLKYAGLAPWEIFVSEAQERMSLAVPIEKLETFMSLAKEMHVTAADLGEFNNSGNLDLFYQEEQVASLSMEFLHKGVPTLQLQATWAQRMNEEPKDDQLGSFDLALCQRILSRYNICSKEDWVRQYDHEVQGMSVIKPFSGVKADAPSDAAVIRPDVNTWRGLAIAHGLLPRYSDIDTYHMTCNVMDEAIRSLVASGADPDSALGLDNFCWPDPVATAQNPDGEYKMAQLVRSNEALRDMALATNIPLVSGKDSMKNDYVGENLRISIPPTLLYTAIAVVPDIRQSVSMDFKSEGDIIFLLGETKDELGGSELYDELGFLGNNVPQVNVQQAMARYRKLHVAMKQNLVASAHDLSEGGLIVTLAESCFGARLGAEVTIPTSDLSDVRFMFSESASRLLISCKPEHRDDLIKALDGEPLAELGKVAGHSSINVAGQSLPIDDLYRAWRQPLSELE